MARQHDRRAAGIGGRIDPGVDALAGFGKAAEAPVESRGDARIFLRPGNESRRDEADEHRGAQRVAIDVDDAGGRQTGPQQRHGAFGATPVQAPEGLRRRVLAGIAEPVVENRRRALA